MRTLGAAAAVTVAGALLAGCAGGPGGGGGKISGGKVVLAVLNDQSGIYSQLSGQGSVTAVRLAIADYQARYGAKAVAKKIDVVSADHQNKPDIANSKAQELYDRRQADVILDVPTSSAALAVGGVAKARKKLFFDVSAATTELEGAQCNKYTFHYGYNSYMLANGTGGTVTHDGAKNWYIVYPDYAFGQDMNKSFTTAVRGAGGTVVKSDPAPFPNDNFSSFLLKAPSLNPKPQVLGAMQAGGDLVNLVKQYNEFKLREQGINLSVGLMFITDIHSLGPDAFAGTTFTDAWYWNFDDRNRQWADRFTAKTQTRPSFAHAANYSAALNYLEAVQAAGTDDADTIVKSLEGKKINDFFLRNGEVRAADHNVTHDVYLAKVKTKDQVKEAWDYEEITKTVPAAQAYAAPDGSCKLS
jgi:branched-chain amino acid transport system substrate-binding protein